ncbi:hypothetical protein PanWU01x14_063640 [Parasponia andersonii]|uniref:Uncharacterized protein n=1 Tax=Parasponia andersonii TaxID=3476 RepID=A0A2P5DH16_PARAD|nr:hypothetical protein PanWU01x14_063640 [Parasponia andersonii]
MTTYIYLYRVNLGLPTGGGCRLRHEGLAAVAGGAPRGQARGRLNVAAELVGCSGEGCAVADAGARGPAVVRVGGGGGGRWLVSSGSVNSAGRSAGGAAGCGRAAAVDWRWWSQVFLGVSGFWRAAGEVAGCRLLGKTTESA